MFVLQCARVVVTQQSKCETKKLGSKAMWEKKAGSSRRSRPDGAAATSDKEKEGPAL